MTTPAWWSPIQSATVPGSPPGVTRNEPSAAVSPPYSSKIETDAVRVDKFLTSATLAGRSHGRVLGEQATNVYTESSRALVESAIRPDREGIFAIGTSWRVTRTKQRETPPTARDREIGTWRRQFYWPSAVVESGCSDCHGTRYRPGHATPAGRLRGGPSRAGTLRAPEPAPQAASARAGGTR